MGIDTTDKEHLRQCVELARQAAEAGDYPFGSVLVDANGTVRYTDRNRMMTKADVSWHPEFTIVLWAQTHMNADERAGSTVYTSGEHCQMCSTAHGYAGLGRIVFASSSGQLHAWQEELGITPSRVKSFTVKEVIPSLTVDGPDDELAGEVRKLHEMRYKKFGE